MIFHEPATQGEPEGSDAGMHLIIEPQQFNLAYIATYQTVKEPFNVKGKMVAGDRIELSTRGFSVRCSTN